MPSQLLKFLVIGTGGFLGAILRYLVSGWIQNSSGSVTFPFGTLGVNLLGCVFIGMLSYWIDHRSLFSVETRLFLLIGFLGSFTTFSTFSNETMNLLRDGRLDLAFLNGAGQIMAGIFLVWLGRVGAAMIWR